MVPSIFVNPLIAKSIAGIDLSMKSIAYMRDIILAAAETSLRRASTPLTSFKQPANARRKLCWHRRARYDLMTKRSGWSRNVPWAGTFSSVTSL